MCILEFLEAACRFEVVTWIMLEVVGRLLEISCRLCRCCLVMSLSPPQKGS